jgi:NAD(P)-dependent dehydrogenase (short-subunit alcohol dehydrogenase family)
VPLVDSERTVDQISTCTDYIHENISMYTDQRRDFVTVAPDVSSRSIAELISLSGRIAVVTGGAVGIGLGIAHRFAEAGARVVIADIASTTAAVAEVASRSGGEVHGRRLDVTDGASIADCAQQVRDEFGAIDIWVNNAGIYPSVGVLEMTDAQWDAVLDVNLRGAFIGAREAAKHMVDAGRGGVIINMASIAAFRAGGPGIAHYVASKHALHGLTKSLAVELGPLGVRVLAIAPAMVETPGMDAGAQALRDAGNADAFDSFAATLPLRRFGKPDDVARVALFCASDLAVFMTGSALLVDAGYLA